MQEPLIPTKVITRSSYLYKKSKALNIIFIQNHLNLQILSTINAYKLPEPLIPTIIGLFGFVKSTKAFWFLKHYQIKIVCFSISKTCINAYKFSKPLAKMIVLWEILLLRVIVEKVSLVQLDPLDINIEYFMNHGFFTSKFAVYHYQINTTFVF